MEEIIHTGKELARKEYARIVGQGKRWQSRNIPLWIRENMLVPYYIANIDGHDHLFIIQYPESPTDKVHFIPFPLRK